MGPETGQEAAYREMGIPELVDGFLGGHDACALAYGQTGSGKTHTMTGGSRPGGSGLIVPPPPLHRAGALLVGSSSVGAGPS